MHVTSKCACERLMHLYVSSRFKCV